MPDGKTEKHSSTALPGPAQQVHDALSKIPGIAGFELVHWSSQGGRQIAIWGFTIGGVPSSVTWGNTQ